MIRSALNFSLIFVFVVGLPGLGAADEATTLRGVRAAGGVDLWYGHVDHSRPAPAKNVGNDIFYQVFIDRFDNGNPANDCLAGSAFCDPSRNDWYLYWGGDLRGLIERSSYLKELGITKLWITPIFKNQQVLVERYKHGENVLISSYHGYWINDWFRLNDMLTDQGETDFAIVDELIASLAPIGLMLDSVTNHTNPVDATDASISELQRSNPLPSADYHRGAFYEDGVFVGSLGEDLARRSDHSHRRKFHLNGDITNWDDLQEVETFRLDGLSDLDQSNSEVTDYLRRAHDFWLERFPALAGYRMDTIKHVNQTYWRQFDQDLFSRFPSAQVIGEYFNAGPYQSTSHPFFNDTGMTMFDFDFRYAMADVFLRDEPMWLLTDLWAQDSRLLDARQIVTFLDNHDVARLRGLGLSERRMAQAVALWFTARGVPCIYYGMEQDLFHPGDPGDPYNRPQMVSFDEGSPWFDFFEALIDLRQRNEALRYGSTHVVHLSEHILAYERHFDGKTVVFATSKNPRQGADRFELNGLQLADGRYRDVLSGRTYQVEAGRVEVALQNGDVVILDSTTRL